MTALDTNVLARLALDDDPEQARRARRIVEAGPCLVPPTVLLELAWVLRRSAGGAAARIVRVIRTILGYPTVHVADAEAVRQALDDAEAGMDLADAFHRAFAAGADRVVTFDQRFVMASAGRPGVPVEVL